jgi:nickel superoxide dismutase
MTILLFSAIPAEAHCQVPCGIYGDEARFDMIEEHLMTIEKSMNEIKRLSAEGDKNYNQIVRWVNTKETHAGYIDEIITSYFMAQRVKLPEDKTEAAMKTYIQKLSLLHHMLVYSMKCKQTTDTENVNKLKQYATEFKKIYFHKD